MASRSVRDEFVMGNIFRDEFVMKDHEFITNVPIVSGTCRDRLDPQVKNQQGRVVRGPHLLAVQLSRTGPRSGGTAHTGIVAVPRKRGCQQTGP